jgi:23S rRNA (pseudouridine1915-N3)-methyltransferase
LRLLVLSVGRLKDGPERVLADEYLARARRTGLALGYKRIEEIEVEAGGGSLREGERLVARLAGVSAIRLDETGDGLSSAAFSRRLARARDAGEDLAFVIGGADGFHDIVRRAAPTAISFGVQTWPHRLVRAMLCEQIYRALSIESGHPYHRE